MSGATPLVAVTSAGDGIYGKLEYLHPSGSLKHRSIPPFITGLLADGLLSTGHTIAIRSAGAAAVTTAWAGAVNGCKVITVLPPWATDEVVREIEWLGATVVQVEPQSATAVLDELEASPDVMLISQAAEPRLIDHYRVVADEIMDQLPSVAAVVVGIGTGLSVTGIGRALVARRDIGVFGAEPAEAPIAAGGAWAPHKVPGLAPPIEQPLLDHSVLSGLLAVPSNEAWRVARRTAQRDGHMVGPSSGLTLAAAVDLRRQGMDGPIVAVCACSMGPYLTMMPTGDDE